MVNLMNHWLQLLDRKESFDYTDPTPYISRQFLPPLPQQIVSNTARPTPDVNLGEHKTDYNDDPKLS
jgi:hypothetical protein